MKANKYLIDYDIRLSEDKQVLRLLRNTEVFSEISGPEAFDMFRKLTRIEEVINLGFSYCFLEYDDIIDEWYEINLVEPSRFFEGLTLVYHILSDEFELLENGMRFTEIVKAEKMIKVFKNEK